jgi:hypothetical protein
MANWEIIDGWTAATVEMVLAECDPMMPKWDASPATRRRVGDTYAVAAIAG